MRHNARILDINWSWEKSYFLPLGICSLVLLFGLWFHSDIFLGTEPRSYHIEGNRYLLEDEILSLFPANQSDYPSEMIEKDLKKHPRILSGKVSQEGRFQFKIIISEKEPFIVYQFENHIYELDQEYQPISMDDIRSQGKIIFSSNIHPDQKSFIQIQTQLISNEFKLFPALEKKVSEVEFDGEGNFTLYLTDPNPIRVELGKNISRKTFQKLNTSISYIEKNKLNFNQINLKGEEAILYSL